MTHPKIERIVAECTAVGAQILDLKDSKDDDLTVERLALVRYAYIADLLQGALNLLDGGDSEDQKIRRSISTMLGVFVQRVVASVETCKRLEAQEMILARASTLH